MRRFTWIVAVACLAANPERPSGKIQIDAALVTLIAQVEVPAREEGVLSVVSAREGQLVKEQDLLAKTDDAEAQIAERRARIDLEIAKKEAGQNAKLRAARKTSEVAKAELKRAQESVEKYKKSISESEIDRLRLAADRSAIEIEEAQHAFEAAALNAQLKESEHELTVRNVERRKILAPLPGMVVQVHRQPGEWVKPGETVLRIVRIDRLRVEGFVNSKNLTQDLTGHAVTLTVDLPGRPKTTFAGSVVFVSPEVNPVNGQVRVWAEVENRDLLLRPGLQGMLGIEAAAPATARLPK